LHHHKARETALAPFFCMAILLTPHAIRIEKLKRGFGERAYTAGSGEERRDEDENRGRPFLEEPDSCCRRSQERQARQKKNERKKNSFKEDFTARARAVISPSVSKIALIKATKSNGILLSPPV
jgi:hypothetical protein